MTDPATTKADEDDEKKRSWIVTMVIVPLLVACIAAVAQIWSSDKRSDGSASGSTATVSATTLSPSSTTPAAPSTSLVSPSRDELLKQLVFLDTPYLSVQRIKSSELIAGRRGFYFYVDFRSGGSGTVAVKTFLFEPGVYTASALNRDFNEGLNKFYVDHWVPLVETQTSGNPELFVTGSADLAGNDSFVGQFVVPSCAGQEFGRFEYLPKLAGAKLETLFAEVTQSKEGSFDKPTYRNIDLPNLRARSMQCSLLEFKSDFNPRVLEGEVINQLGPEYRSAVTILYVPDPTGILP
jgi:hypothetical protein